MNVIIEYLDLFAVKAKRFGMYLTSFFTVRMDPFGISNSKLRTVGRESAYEYIVTGRGVESRIAHWMYRWYSSPSIDTWKSSMGLLGISFVPNHRIYVFGEGLEINIRISLNDGSYSVSGSFGKSTKKTMFGELCVGDMIDEYISIRRSSRNL